jgi:hypothetical protein
VSGWEKKFHRLPPVAPKVQGRGGDTHAPARSARALTFGASEGDDTTTTTTTPPAGGGRAAGGGAAGGRAGAGVQGYTIGKQSEGVGAGAGVDTATRDRISGGSGEAIGNVAGSSGAGASGDRKRTLDDATPSARSGQGRTHPR